MSIQENRVSGRQTATEVIATVVLSTVCSFIVLLPAIKNIGVPWGASDMTLTYFVAGVWDWWRFAFTPDYGFPTGMNPNTFAGLDIVQMTFAQLVGLMTGNPFVGINLLLVLSFPIVAALAYAAIRLVGLSGPIAVALATAFTFIPFHFGRGIGHVLLATTFGAVTGIILVLLVGSGRFQDWMTKARGQDRYKRIALIVVLVLVSAWSGLYYAVFTMIFLAAAVLWRIGQGDSARRLALGSIPFGSTVAAAGLGILPILLSRSSTAAVALRDPIESVTYAGNTAIALIPQPYSVLSPGYNEFVFNLFKAAPPGEPNLMSNYGTWITSACLIAMVVGLLQSARSHSLSRRLITPVNAHPTSTALWQPLNFIAYLIVVLILFFMPWGLNFLMANFLTAQIRGWNRLVPVLLLLLVLGASAALSRYRWPHRQRVAIPIAALIVLVMIIDMILPWRNLYSMVSEDGRRKSDDLYGFAASVNAALPEGCGVHTLPLMLYPESGPIMPAIESYDHFMIGMTNPSHPISYGAIRDTPASAWQLEINGVPTPQQISDMKFKGFCAVSLDTYGYESPAAIKDQMAAQLGAPVATSPSGRWQMYRLP